MSVLCDNKEKVLMVFDLHGQLNGIAGSFVALRDDVISLNPAFIEKLTAAVSDCAQFSVALSELSVCDNGQIINVCFAYGGRGGESKTSDGYASSIHFYS